MFDTALVAVIIGVGGAGVFNVISPAINSWLFQRPVQKENEQNAAYTRAFEEADYWRGQVAPLREEVASLRSEISRTDKENQGKLTEKDKTIRALETQVAKLTLRVSELELVVTTNTSTIRDTHMGAN